MSDGNGAREALIGVSQTVPNMPMADSECWTDWLLAALWMRGFVLVPLKYDETRH